MRLSIIVPCYNEAATIEAVVHEVIRAPLPQGWDREVIVVDDGSDIDTKNTLRRLSGADVPFRLVTRERNGGKGAAVKDGLRSASGEYIVIQDADQEYDPTDFAALLQPIVEGKTDAVFGSRVLKDNNVSYNFAYFYGGLLVTRIFNLLFGTQLSDLATCYKVFPNTLVPRLVASSHDDFVFDAVDLTLAIVHGVRYEEVPISYRARTKKAGKKLNWLHGIEIVFSIFLARAGIGTERRSGASKVLRFLISGTSAAIVNFATLFILTEYFSIWYLISSGIAFSLAFLVSFTMQKYWTFRSMDQAKIRRQLPMHFAVAVLNLSLDLLMVYTLVEYVGIWYLFAQVIATALIAVESFFAFRFIFR